MYCSKCGKQINGNGRFCSYCGTLLSVGNKKLPSSSAEQASSRPTRSYYEQLFIIAAVLVVLIAVLFAVQRGNKPVSNKEIRKSIENYEYFSSLEAEITNIEIIERKSAIKDRSDRIYVTVQASNDFFSATRNYILAYTLYDDGWHLETIEPYVNPECPDDTVPKQGVSHEQVLADIYNLNLESYASNLGEIYNATLMNNTTEDLQSGKYLDIDDNFYCCYNLRIEYLHYTFLEMIEIPLTYTFYGYDTTQYSYGWHLWIDDSAIVRCVELHDGILGLWSNKEGSWWGIEGYVYIESHEKGSCSAILNIPNWSNGQITETLILDYFINDENGKINNISLVWDDPQPEEDEYWDGIYFDLFSYEPKSIAVGYQLGYWYKE